MPMMPLRPPIGWWRPTTSLWTIDAETAKQRIGTLSEPLAVIHTPDGPAVGTAGESVLGQTAMPADHFPLLGMAPALTPAQLGSSAFLADHRVRFPYMTGAMANGIASCELVEAVSRAGMLGSFGAAGLSLARVTAAVERLQANLGHLPFAINLIHSPNEPAHELATTDLLLQKGVTLIEASAYLDLTPAVVKFRATGLAPRPDGSIHIGHRIIAKVSRSEVAARFLAPASPRILKALQERNQITAEQAELAQRVPMCDDLTAEADSGGHTDNRPALTLLPTLIAVRDRLQLQHRFASPVRVGLAGGLSTPASVAAAFALGAAYVVTGSVNQSCIESGSSNRVRTMLASADQADVTMAPAADMFEMGVKVQVLKRGTMFAMRGQKLYELYRAHSSWESIPESDRQTLEKNIFRRTFDEIWAETSEFFSRRDPYQLQRADADARHKLALVFRWYLGLSSRWANSGDETRQLDYQVWCGPAMGAFNEWAKGSVLELPEHRNVVAVGLNLLFGAAVSTRRQLLRFQGLELPGAWFPLQPQSLSQLQAHGLNAVAS